MPEAPTGSSFEADLRALREVRGRSIADIERATRVPADVVRRFEGGALMRDPDFSAVYLRAFVKAYAEALDLSAARVNAAFEAARKGTYQGTLAPAPDPSSDEAKPQHADEPAAEAIPSGPPLPLAPASSPSRAPESTPPPPTSTPSSAAVSESAPMVEALATKSQASRSAPPPVPPRRSSAPSTLNNSNQSWGLILGIALMSVLALSVVFWMIFSDPAPELEPVASAPVVDTMAVPDSTAAAALPAIPPAPQVGDSVQVTLIAAEGPLQNFRVQASPDIRRPYWVEQGTELVFASPTEVTIWGNETATGWRIDSEARLRIAGLTFAPTNGAVQRLTRERAQALVDSLHRAQYEG